MPLPDADRPVNVLDTHLATVLETRVDARAYAFVDDGGHANAAGFGQRLQPGSHVDAVPVYLVTVDNDVAEIDANSQRYPWTFGHLRCDGPLNFQCAVDSVDDTCELDQRTVANQFDDAAAMPRHHRIENGLSMVLQGRQGTGFVGAHHPRIAYYISRQDGSESPAGSHFAHGAMCMGYWSAVPARPEFTLTSNPVVKIQRLVPGSRSSRSRPFSFEVATWRLSLSET